METVYSQDGEPLALAELIDGCAPHRAEPEHSYVVRPGHFAHSSTTSCPADSFRARKTCHDSCRASPTVADVRGFLRRQSGDARDTALLRHQGEVAPVRAERAPFGPRGTAPPPAAPEYR